MTTTKEQAKTTHTPGPWMPVGAAEVCAKKDGRTVALAYGPVANPLDEALANARLMAAAPEMLEALEGLMWRFDDEEPDDPDVRMARAAIVKARGRG